MISHGAMVIIMGVVGIVANCNNNENNIYSYIPNINSNHEISQEFLNKINKPIYNKSKPIPIPRH